MSWSNWLLVQPYCRSGNGVDAGLARRQTAPIHLQRLCEIEVPKEVKVGRDKLSIKPAFLKLLAG